MPSMPETSTSPIRRNAAMTFSTRLSGADAPAVRPTRFLSFEPGGIEFARIGDEVTGHTFPLGRISRSRLEFETVLRADHQNNVRHLAKLPDGRLPVLGGVADI